jgi:hypothetical protein
VRRCTRARPDNRGYSVTQRFHVANEAADRNIDLKQLFDILTAHHAGKVFSANEAVICRHRGSKRIGLMLETSDKNIHEKLPVLRSPTIEGCQSSFAGRSEHVPEIKKIRSLRIAGASHFADMRFKAVKLCSSNSNYGVVSLPNEQRMEQACARSIKSA